MNFIDWLAERLDNLVEWWTQPKPVAMSPGRRAYRDYVCQRYNGNFIRHHITRY